MRSTGIVMSGLAMALLLVVGGCGEGSGDGTGDSRRGGEGQPPAVPATGERVVVYTAVDEPVARPIIERFERETGIRVTVVTDSEAMKTAGLAQRLEAERDNPQADVWWSNEIFHTINLANKGLLAPYQSPAASEIPPMYRDPQQHWAATALRARVITITTARPEAAEAVGSIRRITDLANPALRERICMARPAAGTTSGHMGALYVLMGEEGYVEFLRALRANGIRLLGGNSVVAEEVGRGRMWAGLTDNDDVDAMKREGGRLEMILPDQEEGQFGTLTIPCSVGLVAGARNVEPAHRLIDYLLSREVERMMIDSQFAAYSVFEREGPDAARPMPAGYEEIARNMHRAVELALEILEGRR